MASVVQHRILVGVDCHVPGYVQSTEPSGTIPEGFLWEDSTTGQVYVYHSGAWIPMSGGEKGDTGTRGDTGAAGTGTHGDTGQKGDTGTRGSAGGKGDTGNKGDTGTHGDTGAGTKGDTGTVGGSGTKGDTGAGTKGDTGVGTSGDTGTPGDTGVAGGGSDPVIHTDYDVGTITGAKTINWNNGCMQHGTWTGDATLTFTDPAGACHLRLRVINSGGAHTFGLPASVMTPGGAQPAMSSTDGAIDILYIDFDGATYYLLGSYNFLGIGS